MALRSERRFISKTNIKSGMLLSITYKKNSGEVKDYMLITIDPDKENKFTKNNQLHGLLVDDLSDEELIKMIVTIGNLSYDPTDVRAPLTDIQNDEAYEKFKANYDTKKRYRTFTLDNIRSVRQILVGVPNNRDELKLYPHTRPFTLAEIVDAVGEYFQNEYTYSMFPKLASTQDELAQIIGRSSNVVLTKSQLMSLENSNVEDILISKDPNKSLRDMMLEQEREEDLNRILDGINKQVKLPLPIVIKYSGGYYLMGGNSRLSALAAIGYTMPVKLLTYTG